jgi:predicted Fe-Mo cluster-binding NifX family protein
VKIAFAIGGEDLSSLVHEKFGRAPQFLVFNGADKTFLLVDNPAANGAQGAGIKAAETVVRSGAKAVVAGEFGPKAEELLRTAQVQMHACKPAPVREVLQRLFGIRA